MFPPARCTVVVALGLLLGPVVFAAEETAPPDPVMATMRQELGRSWAVLTKQKVPPYFLSYQLTDNRAISVRSSFGALTGSTDERSRLLDVDLRVGDYQVDNTRRLRSEVPMTNFGAMAGSLPIEDDSQALAVALWLDTDRHYRDAVQRLQAIRTQNEIKTPDKDDDAPDYSRAPVEHYTEPIAPFSFDRAAWEERVRRYGQTFRDVPDIQSAEVWATGEIETRRYINSDGSEIRLSMPFYRLGIEASIKAPDGEVLPLNREFLSFRPDGLPGDEAILKIAEEMKQMLLALKKAPIADAYTGPAILSGRASAVFFHEIFGHRIEADRLKDQDDAQTFKKKLNQAVLPDFISVYSDPTARRVGDTDLVGYYPYDDEGVKARRVDVVEHGILRNFLMSRSPIKGFNESNGHGRRQQGFDVAARQANLFVSASKTVSREQLKKLLIERVEAAHKPFGLFFDDITGGFTFTTRSIPNAFSVLPTVVYRIYPDGHEELVRGLDLIGTPLIAFSKISAADTDVEVFNGMCGAQSGWVPVSAVSPGLLVDQIEVQRKEKREAQDPILPPPNQPSKP